MKKQHGSDLVARLVQSERVVLEGIRENRKLRFLVEEMIEALRVESVDPERYILELKLLGEPFSHDDERSSRYDRGLRNDAYR